MTDHASICRSLSRSLLPGALVVLGLISSANAEDFATMNDLGTVGLLQTPTARFADEGQFGFGISRLPPYNQVQLSLTPLPWFEGTLRYTNITNRFYSADPNFSGTQHYKDRSFGFKLRLLQESEYLPAVAMGIQDIGGTGLFSSEYLIFSRRYYDFDLSFGLGWGRLGAGGSIHNPLSVVSSHFGEDRQVSDTTASTPGGLGLGRSFTGKTIGTFGGVQWHTPIKGLNLQVEYDGNDYQHEALGNRFDQSSPINVALDYAVLDGVDVGVGYERGNTLMVRFNLQTNFQKNIGPAKTADPPPPPIKVRERPANVDDADTVVSPPIVVQATKTVPAEVKVVGLGPAAVSSSQKIPDESSSKAKTVEATRAGLKAQGFTLVAMDFDAERREIKVWIRQDRYRDIAKVVGRTARVMTRTSPDQYEQFTVIGTSSGAETYRYTVLRKDFEQVAQNQISSEELLHDTLIVPPDAGAPKAEFVGLASDPKFSWDMGPAFRQQIGGPDGFYFGQVWWKLSAGLRLNENWNVSSIVGFNIVNNFGDIKEESNSALPHVRSDIVQYLQQGENNLVRLETNYIWSPFSEWYARFSAGIFEEMYGGVAAETLYRPFRQRWAVGIDANYVKQRGFNQQFDFRSYEVATGHLNFYYDFPWYDIKTKVSVGRYLAGDYGSTIDVSRVFRSGVVAGGFVTFTNVSSEKFGEGSFDKGVYISILFDIFYAKSTRREIGFLFRPLTRDGGQKVRDGVDLYSATSDSYGSTTVSDWPDVAR